jgi:endonuclease/exonuclease/phosphatase (EEP) superfamily protein YafD
MPPLSPRFHAARELLLLREAAQATKANTPYLMAGDLNATPWSSVMHKVARAGLVAAGASSPTWPAAFPLLALDHVLGSHHWAVTQHVVGPAVGSDHLPVLARLSLVSVGAQPR